MLLCLQQSLGSSLGKLGFAIPCPLCRLNQRETLASLGKSGFLLPRNMSLPLVSLVSLIPFNRDIIRAFVFLINKLEPRRRFYGADK